MFDFLTILFSMIGLMAISFGLTCAVIHLAECMQAERNRRREHEEQIETILTRIADNTEPKP
jgi:hypothetical protein